MLYLFFNVKDKIDNTDVIVEHFSIIVLKYGLIFPFLCLGSYIAAYGSFGFGSGLIFLIVVVCLLQIGFRVNFNGRIMVGLVMIVMISNYLVI